MNRNLFIYTATVTVGNYLESKYVVAFTESGARQILKHFCVGFFNMRRMNGDFAQVPLETSAGKEGFFNESYIKFFPYQSREDKIYNIISC